RRPGAGAPARPPPPRPAAPPLAALDRCGGDPVASRLDRGDPGPHASPAAIAMAPAPAGAHRLRHALRATEVAPPARPRIDVAEVASQRGAPAPGLLRVLDHRTQAARVLAPEDLETTAQAFDALAERVARHRGVNAPARHTPADPGLDEPGHQRAGGALRDACRERQLLDVGVALLARPRGERAPEAAEQRGRQPREREQM